jgi:exopolyphosphatase/pppGpp-phosphohydrolase
MPVVNIEPTGDFPIPFDLSPENPDTFVEEVAVAGRTAELLAELGAPLEVSPEDVEREKQLFDAVVKKHKTEPLQKINTAFAAAAFLRTYGQNAGFDASQARAAITAKLMEIANCGETKFELKALELLGKHSDIGLFTERSEITINYKNPEALEEAIKDRVKRLLNADVIDVTPIGIDLDEELGIAGVTAQEEPEDNEEVESNGEVEDIKEGEDS